MHGLSAQKRKTIWNWTQGWLYSVDFFFFLRMFHLNQIQDDTLSLSLSPSPPLSLSLYIYIHTHTYIHTDRQTYSTVQYSTVQYSTVQYSTVQSSPVQYSTVQYRYSTVQYNTVQYNTIQYNTIQYIHTYIRTYTSASMLYVFMKLTDNDGHISAVADNRPWISRNLGPLYL